MPLILTIDVEDWAQSTLDTDLPITDRAQRNMENLLDLLDEHDRKVTCFVLGKFAEKFPSTIKRIASAGHEVASHGYGHVDVYQQEPDAFRDDVRRSKSQLEDMTGCEVVGYRAPDFSVVKNSLWALDILSEEGFTYDSSINPAVAARFGIPHWPTEPVEVQLPSEKTIVELPVATKGFLGRSWPVAGGGYHRLFPGFFINRLIASALSNDLVFIAYCHPYEFDPDEFKQSRRELPLKTRLHQGLGRRGFKRKFVNLLTCFNSELARDIVPMNWPFYERNDGERAEGGKVKS